jgi:PAS domain S-box-containing protein
MGDGGSPASEPEAVEKDLEHLFHFSVGMLCIAGIDGYFKRVNAAFERTLGYTAEELLSRPFVEFVHPDDRQRTIEEIDRLARGIETIRFENRYRAKDGSYHWLAWTGMPRPEEGRIYATAWADTLKVPKGLPRTIRRRLKANPAQPWDRVIADLVGTDQNGTA